MGNVVREKPNISLESAQKSATFGVEFEFQSTSNGSLELPEWCKIGKFTNRLASGNSLWIIEKCRYRQTKDITGKLTNVGSF